MKKIKKIFLPILALVIMLSSALPVFADETENSKYYPYVINGYDVEMNVLENNTLQITENIEVCFNEQQHGIFRTIPTKSTITRADGTTGTIHAMVKNIKVTNANSNNSFSVTNGSKECTIKIGDENITLIGNENYTISYDYIMGEDINSGFDELYYNLIGNNWKTTINNVTFKITMPKEFNDSELGFSTGNYGTVGTNNIIYNVNENVITGRVTAQLQPSEALTVRLQLPEGYFHFNKAAYYTKIAIMPLFSILVLITVIILWFKFGKDKKIVEVAEFYPPKGMSSADVAFWNKGSVTNNNLIALLIELANEGYVELEEVADSGLFSKKNKTKIIKLQNKYRGSDSSKQIFFEGLFKHTNKNFIYDSDLTHSFYTTLNSISSSYNTPKNKAKVFNRKSSAMVFAGVLLSAASIVLSMLIMFSTISSIPRLYAFAASVAISLGALILSFFIRQRTEKGYENLQKIKGFKLFLETAEKEKLETLVESNPKYFYDILPYAYVLGVSDKWISKFEHIAFQPADWYHGNNIATYMAFRLFFNNTMNRANETMLSAPQNSSGGGGFSGGGGGFAGGGAGGGGGGSW